MENSAMNNLFKEQDSNLELNINNEEIQNDVQRD